MGSSSAQTGILVLVLLFSSLSSLISGNSVPSLNPPPMQHGQWHPRIDSKVNNNYFPGNIQAHSQSQHPIQHSNTGSVPVYTRIVQNAPVRRQGNWPNTNNVPEPPSILRYAPQPMPRTDESQEKAGLSMISSLLPSSLLNIPQSLRQSQSQSPPDHNIQQQQDSESDNLIETESSNNNSPYMGATGPQQSSDQQQYQQETGNQPEQFSLPGLNQFGPSNSGQSFPFSKGQFQNQQSDLVGTSQEDDGADPEPMDSGNDDTTSSESEGGSGIFSRLRNVILLGKGFISGLLSNKTTTAGYGYAESSNSNEVFDMNGSSGDDDGGSFPSLTNLFRYPSEQEQPINSEADDNSSPTNLNLLGGGGGRFPNIFSIHPTDISPTSEGSNHDVVSNPDSADDANQGGTGLNFLSSLSNPFQRVRDFISNFKLPSLSTETEEGGYENSPSPTPPVDITQHLSLDPMLSLSTNGEDISVTPLQSLVNGGIGGALGPVLRIISKIADTYALTTAGFSKLKVGILVLGPIFAAALAAMIVGIVYISVYIPAWSITNEALDGDFYIIPFKQLLSILGLPDPLEELFGFRSFKGRSISDRRSNITMFGLDDHKKEAFLNGTVHERGQCMERFACEFIGRKLLQREWWKNGYIAKGIRHLGSRRSKLKMSPSPRTKSKWPTVDATIKFLDAVATGLTEEQKKLSTNEIKERKHNSIYNASACMKYACDPIKTFKKLVKKKNVELDKFNNNFGLIDKLDFKNQTSNTIHNITNTNSTVI